MEGKPDRPVQMENGTSELIELECFLGRDCITYDRSMYISMRDASGYPCYYCGKRILENLTVVTGHTPNIHYVFHKKCLLNSLEEQIKKIWNR